MQWNRCARVVIGACFVMALLLASASGVEAASPRYKYIEGGWLKVDPDQIGSENGFFFGGMFDLRSFHFFGEYGDPGNFEVWQAGGGWHGLFGERLDLVLQAAFIDFDFDDGLRLSAGIRWMLLEQLEVNGFIHHTDLDKFSDQDTIALNGIWDLTPRFGVGAGFEGGDDIDTIRAFARFNLGRQN